MKTRHLFFISLLLPALAFQSGAQEREVSFTLSEHPLAAALDSLSRWFAVPIIYMDRDVAGVRVTASSEGCTLNRALQLILGQTAVEAYATGTQILVRRRPALTARPTAVIAGTVIDSVTGNTLAGASVVLRRKDTAGESSVVRWCPTNSFGFFSLQRVPPGEYVIEVRSVGYHAAVLPIQSGTSEPLTQDVALRQESISLEEVTIEGQRMASSATAGLSRGLFIRSAPTDQNEYLLDGARIYNPAHYGGVLSSFHPEALNDVEISTSGLPPSYGGRIGGILDLSLRDGTRERFSGSVGTGFLGSQLSFEGPLDPSTTFLLSGRRGYSIGFVPNLSDHGVPSKLGSLELITKVSHRISGHSRLSFSGYVGSDRYNADAEGNGFRMTNSFVWGNTALNLRWLSIVSPSTFVHASTIYTRYTFSVNHAPPEIPGIGATSSLNSTYAIEDFAVRAHAEHFYDQFHTVRGGIEIVRHGITGGLSRFDTQLAPYSLQDRGVWELSLYGQDRWAILDGVQAELGIRATSFTSSSGSFSGVDPRFSVLFDLSERTRLFASITSVNQFLHPYRNSGVFQYYPTVFWYPSGAGISPTTSLRFSVGAQQDIQNSDVTLFAEGFYRAIHNLHDVQWAGVEAGYLDLTDYIITGSGRSYGVDLSLRKRSGLFSGSLSYTLAWTDQTFAEHNGGIPYAPQFDRRHEFHGTLAYMPHPDWILSVLAVLPAGETDERNVSASNTYVGGEVDVQGGRGSLAIGDFDVNGSRFPGFQRLELQIIHRFSIGSVAGRASLQFINGYGLLDPIVQELQSPGSDSRFLWRARLREIRLFPLFPVVGVTFTF